MYKQSFKLKTSDSKKLNKADLVFTYKDGVDVKVGDFKLTTDNGVVSPSLYTLDVDTVKKQLKISLSKDALNNKLKDKEITIQQNSVLQTDNRNILSAYDSKSKSFDFEIKGYNKWNFSDNDPYLTSKLVNEHQKIYYEPNITAEPVVNLVVEKGSEVKDAKEYIKNLSKPDFDFDHYKVEFKEKPTFDTPGEQQFTVLVKSDIFQTVKEIPVTLEVKNPVVNMTINQVYKDNENQNIYSDLNSQKEIKPKTVSKKSGTSINDVLNELNHDENTKINYEDYLPIIDEDNVINPENYKIIVDGKEQKTETVPNKDFELVVLYQGLIEFKGMPKLDYGSVSVFESLNKFFSLKNKENNELIISNSSLSSNWSLYASIPEGIQDFKNNKQLKGGLVYFDGEGANLGVKIETTSTFICSQDSAKNFVTKINLSSAQNANKGLKLKQDSLNSKGDYKGAVVWSLRDVPKSY